MKKSAFKQNVGALDQWLRFAVGFVLLFLTGAGIIGPWGYIGLVPLLTAMFRFCPLYHVLGLDSGKSSRKGDPA